MHYQFEEQKILHMLQTMTSLNVVKVFKQKAVVLSLSVAVINPTYVKNDSIFEIVFDWDNIQRWDNEIR